jgi:hypothetical protein
LIKENTSSSSGKAVSIPGHGNEAEKEFERQLYATLQEEHERIKLFVKSKTGEIERRLSKNDMSRLRLTTTKRYQVMSTNRFSDLNPESASLVSPHAYLLSDFNAMQS